MYKMMTAKQVIDYLWTLEKNEDISFTFDDIELDPDIEPTGWYGIKIARLFDEFYGFLAIGYWGGSCTQIYSLDEIAFDFSRTKEDNDFYLKQFCVLKLQEFMNSYTEYDYPCNKICVEINTIE